MFTKSLLRHDGKNSPRELVSPLTAMHSRMSRLFDDFFPDWSVEPFSGWSLSDSAFSPRVNVDDTDKEVRVTAELPGVDEKDIEVTVTAEALTIRGEKRHEHEEKAESHYHVERSFGSFERTLPLFADVDTDKVDAKFSKGVLTITLPKTEETRAKVKQVKVKAD